MKILKVKEGGFYADKAGEIIKAVHGTDNVFRAETTSGYLELAYHRDGTCPGCADKDLVREATPEEIRAYKAASPRYPNCFMGPDGSYNEITCGECEPSPIAENEPSEPRAIGLPEAYEKIAGHPMDDGLKAYVNQLVDANPAKPRRKVVQIITGNGVVVALCDDGSLWGLMDSTKSWIQLPDIPQE